MKFFSSLQVYVRMVYGNFINNKKYKTTETLDGGKFSGVPWVSAMIEGRGRYQDPLTGLYFKIISSVTKCFVAIQVCMFSAIRLCCVPGTYAATQKSSCVYTLASGTNSSQKVWLFLTLRASVKAGYEGCT